MEKIRCPDCDVEWPHLHIRPLEEVLNYRSCDAPAYGGKYGRDCLDGKRDDAAQIHALRTLIERDGFKAGYGIGIELDGEFIHDGHHRLTVMHDIGAYWCPVQSTATHARDTDEYRDSQREYYTSREKFRKQRAYA